MDEKIDSGGNDRFSLRKNPRLFNYDYSTPNYYFITVCTHHKKAMFWSNNLLNSFGDIVKQGIEQIPKHFPNNRVDKYVVMPNHVHLILTVEPGGADISIVVGSFKSFVSNRIHQIDPRIKVWQVSFHDHVIRNRSDYQKIWEYIDLNPYQWNQDCFFTE